MSRSVSLCMCVRKTQRGGTKSFAIIAVHKPDRDSPGVSTPQIIDQIMKKSQKKETEMREKHNG